MDDVRKSDENKQMTFC